MSAASSANFTKETWINSFKAKEIMGGQAWKSRRVGKRKRSLTSISQVVIQSYVCVSRRLNTLNKCASMKLDVSLQRKKVITFNSYLLSIVECCTVSAFD